MGTRMGNMCAKMAKIAKRWQNILKEGVHEIFDFAFFPQTFRFVLY